MPTYDYVCQACGHRLEVFQSMSESPKRKCPACGKSKLQRQIGAGAAILFKGSGFYQTDYRSSSYTEGKQREGGGEKSSASDAAKPDAAAKSDATSKSASGSAEAPKTPATPQAKPARKSKSDS